MSCPAPSLPVHRCAGFVVFRRNKGEGDEGEKVEFLLLQVGNSQIDKAISEVD